MHGENNHGKKSSVCPVREGCHRLPVFGCGFACVCPDHACSILPALRTR